MQRPEAAHADGALAAADVERYKAEGFLLPDPPMAALTPAEAAAVRAELERAERDEGVTANKCLFQGHITRPWMHKLVTSPRILGRVEKLIGPDILVLAAQFFVKEPGSGAYVGWHQDANYWGIEPYNLVTAWVAITDVTADAGPVRFLRGSHAATMRHVETYEADNLLSRGQEIAFEGEPDPSDVADAVLRPGEFALFNVQMAHSSSPNTSSDRRIGLAIRYMPTSTRSIRPGGDTAMLVRGVDAFGHFGPDLPPHAHASPEAAEAARLRSIELTTSNVMVDADMERFRAVTEERARRNVPEHLRRAASKV